MSASGMADMRCSCGYRFGFPYREPLPASVPCPRCHKANSTAELSHAIADFARMREQAHALNIVSAFAKAGFNAAEIAHRIGIREGRVRPFLHGSITLTDDEFKTVSENLELPVPFRSPTKKEAHGQT